MSFTKMKTGEGTVCAQGDVHISQEFCFVPVKFERLVNILSEMLRW